MKYSLLSITVLMVFIFNIAHGDSLDPSELEKQNKITCKEGFEKIIKKTNQKNVCVKETSVEKLIQRGWAQMPKYSVNTIEFGSENTPKTIAQKINSECKFNMDCVISNLNSLSEIKEQEEFEDSVLELLKIYESSPNSCHTQGHHIGMFLYSYYDDVNKAISKAGLECGGALYHGILETHFGAEKFFDNYFDEFQANKICAEEFVDSKIKKWECLHGLGHGLVIAYEYDVFEPLKFCNFFDGWELHACARGIFMENMIHVTNTSEGTIDEHDMFYPCNKVQEQFAPDCYIYQSYYLQIITRGYGSVATTFSLCDEIEPPEFIKNCYVGVGANMGELANSRARDLAISNCMKGDSDYSSYCLVGMMRILADQQNTETAMEFCNSVPEESKPICFEYFGKWVDLVSNTSEEKITVCSNIEESKYSEICSRASAEEGEFI